MAYQKSLLWGIHELLLNGNVEEAEIELNSILRTSENQEEIDYLTTWKNLLQNEWESVLQFLMSYDESSSLIEGTLMRRRPYCCLLLGNIAAKMLFPPEEVIYHYEKGIMFLNKRRMNIPSVRMKILYQLGCIHVLIKDLAVALNCFNDALVEFSLSKSDDTLFYANILEKKSEVLFSYGEDGRVDGKAALGIYQGMGNIPRVLSALLVIAQGCYRRKDYFEAYGYYQESFQIAFQNKQIVPLIDSALGLVETCLKQSNILGARYVSNIIRGYYNSSEHDLVQAKLCLIFAKVVLGEFHSQQMVRRNEIILWFENAINLLEVLDNRLLLLNAYEEYALFLEEIDPPKARMLYQKAYLLNQ